MDMLLIEWICPMCQEKGHLNDVFINALNLMVRGTCERCGRLTKFRSFSLEQIKLDLQPGAIPIWDEQEAASTTVH